MIRLRSRIFHSLLLASLLSGISFAQDDKARSTRTRGPVRWAKSADVAGPIESVLNINALTSFVDTKGFFDAVVDFSWNGEFPKGSGVGVIFREGIVWGAKVSDDNPLRVRVGGSSQTNGLQGGRAVGYSTDPYSAPTGFEDPAVQQVWRVRTDWETADLTIDAASFNLKGVADVTETEIADIKAQYSHDSDHWPAAAGAPYDDVDGNGSYDPATDIPGVPGASQTMWFVSNDLDDNVSAVLAGSPSIGLEMQMTLWAYDFASTSPLGNMSFKRVRLIYTGQINGSPTASIDTMYVTQWSDPDLGDFTDDFVGTDVDLSLGFVYNGSSHDDDYANIGYPPPAAGYTLLKGPVSGGETVGMSSFTFFGAGSGVSDPDRGVYSGTLQWFNLMEGFLPRPEYPEQEPMMDPITGEATKFWLDGDPVTQTGWVDGLFLPPGDRRMLWSTGPFEMALGDTQDIIIAFIAGIGNSRLESIDEIRKAARIAHSFYENGFIEIPVPELIVVQPNSSQADLTITLDLSFSADKVIAKVYNYDDVLEGTLSLFDDGNNADGAANDMTWGIQWLTDQRAYGMYANVLIISGTDTAKWEHLLDKITTLGPVDLVDMIIVNDNINNDGVINSGEKFGFNPVINNGSSFEIGSAIVATSSFDDYVVLRSLIQATPVDFLPPGITILEDNPEQYFVLSDNTPDGHLLTLRSWIVDKLHNSWASEFQVTVNTLPFNIEFIPALHIAGSADGLAGYRMADVSALTGDQYEITFNGVESIVTFNLKNLTTVNTLLEFQTFPEDIYSSNIPITEGFKVVFDEITPDAPTTFYDTEFTVDANPSDGDLRLWGDATLFGNPTGLYLEFGGGGGSAVDVSILGRDLQLRFTGIATDNFEVVTSGGSIGTQYPRAAFGDPNAFSGPHVLLRLPFELWDVENDRQVNVAVINRNEDGMSPYGDDIGDPNTPGIEPRWRITGRDYIIPVMTDYNPSTPININDIFFSTWMLFFRQGGESVWSTGDVFTVRYANPLEPGIDIYQFQAIPTAIGSEAVIPENFELSQNYPNPFNPSTTFEFSLPQNSTATFVIYDILGRQVNKLLDGKQFDAGRYTLRWNGKNEAGIPVSSGLYIYRIDIKPEDKSGSLFTKTRKMVLLR